MTTSKQQERCTCGTNAEGNPTECQIHGPELFKSHPAQPVEQGEQERGEQGWRYTSEGIGVTGPGLRALDAAGFPNGENKPMPEHGEVLVRATALTTANQQIEELTERLDAFAKAEATGQWSGALDLIRTRLVEPLEAKIEELTRERDELLAQRDSSAQFSSGMDGYWQGRYEAAEAQRDTLREAVSAAFSATYNPDISHLTSTRTVRNILQSVLITPPDKGDE